GRGDPGRRLGVTLLAIAFVLTLFAGRLVQIQGMESGAYKSLSEAERLTTTPLPAVRGSITGSDGQVLAMTIEKYTVTADPPLVTDKPVAAQQLAGPLGQPAATILKLLTHPSSPQYVLLAKGVSAQNEAKIADIPGISASPTYARVYPDGNAAANVVGFTSEDGNGTITGRQGIEEAENRLLSGTPGSEETEVGESGQQIPGTQLKQTPAVDGSGIRLTINPSLQYQAEQACQQRVRQVNARDCTIVIMQPKTGDILAMAQWPSYSQSHVRSVAETTDLPVASTFQPGSTAKVITAAAALEHGGQTPMSAYNIPYAIYKGGQWIHDAEWQRGERYTIAGIIANSSNIGMTQVAEHVSPQMQYQYLRNFGLDQPTGLDLPGESSGLLPPPSRWWPDEHYTLAYGQGVAANAVQMASVYATIANGGVRVQPRLIAGTTSTSGKFTAAAASPTRRVIQPSTARQLIQILQQVPAVDQKANQPWGIIPGYAVAAKTGTSNETGPGCKPAGSLCQYGSSYIGMAPGNNPQVVVAVNVQDPKKENAYFGDVVAGPVFYQVMKETLATLQIPPQPGLNPANVRLNAP
ncbi:MAG: penicillin-binding protein 2, partial [Nocardiopsaceae bacterium]|nr:penicillin-binding protein 2 [Nocardiopsaceae bacterium]